MMKRAGRSRSGLFLIELIIATLFFSIASAVCVRLFVHAHLLSRDSRDLTTAMTLAQNSIEIAKSGADAPALAGYDRDGNRLGDEADWYLRVETDPGYGKGPIQYIAVAVYRQGEEDPLYEIETGRYVDNYGGNQ